MHDNLRGKEKRTFAECHREPATTEEVAMHDAYDDVMIAVL